MGFGKNLGNLDSTHAPVPTQPPLFVALCRHPGCRREFFGADVVSALESMVRHATAAHQEQKES